jgi:hypothetical protein
MDIKQTDLHFSSKEISKTILSKQSELLTQAKVCRKWAQLVHELSSSIEPKHLQYELSPINAIYQYLCTDLSSELRYKELLKMLYSKKEPSYFSVS